MSNERDWAKMLYESQPRWQRFEKWLFERNEKLAKRGITTWAFTNQQVAAEQKISFSEASRLIQAYLNAQRANLETMFVLKREGRTSASNWSVGQRTADARVIGGTLFEDVSVKVTRAFRPDVQRLAAKNPKAARYCEQKIDAVMDGALKVLAASVDAFLDEDDE